MGSGVVWFRDSPLLDGVGRGEWTVRPVHYHNVDDGSAVLERDLLAQHDGKRYLPSAT